MLFCKLYVDDDLVPGIGAALNQYPVFSKTEIEMFDPERVSYYYRFEVKDVQDLYFLFKYIVYDKKIMNRAQFNNSLVVSTSKSIASVKNYKYVILAPRISVASYWLPFIDKQNGELLSISLKKNQMFRLVVLLPHRIINKGTLEDIDDHCLEFKAIYNKE